MKSSNNKRFSRLLLAAACGIVVLQSAGCRTFDPVDSFFAHLDRFKPAFEEAFRKDCGQPDSSEYKFHWGLDCLSIKQQEDLLTPYRALSDRIGDILVHHIKTALEPRDVLADLLADPLLRH